MQILLFVSTAVPALYTGKWSGELVGVPSGTLGEPTSHAPLLGNGYMGVTLSSQRSPVPLERNGTTLDLWINSNANWDCQSSGKDAPPALCSCRMLGMLSIAVLGDSFADTSSSTLVTEQRTANGTLWTRRVARDGTTIETESLVHPDRNVLVTDVFVSADASTVTTAAGSSTAPFELQATLLSYGKNRHVGASTRASCQLVNSTTTGAADAGSWSAACSRRYHDLSGTARGAVGPRPRRAAAAFRTPWSAVGLTTAPDGDQPAALAQGNATTNGYEVEYVTASFKPQAGRRASVRLVVSLTDNLLGANDDDPAPAARALAISSRDAGVVVQDARAFWNAFWAASAVALPTRPALARMWYGSQYATASGFPSARVVAQSHGLAAPPGLYGPWTTADYAFWNGDYTLDYNQEANYYHIYSSNRAERAASYFRPVLDWLPAARVQAAQVAAAANLSGCAPHALHFATHLAPWGAQSRDTSVYGHCNGAFAALLFINAWEYTRDVAFAANVTLPLLDGVNAWHHCYLYRNVTANGTLVLEDWNALSPDEVQENNPRRNPITGTALIRRVATAQRDIARAIGVAYPPYVDEIIMHLVAPPTTMGPDGARVWSVASGVDWRDSASNFGYAMPLFPLWPAETVQGLTADAATRAVAAASLALYGNLSCAPNYPRPPFKSCVDAGTETVMFFMAAARALAGALPDSHLDAGALTSASLATALEQHISAYGANATNLLAYAPGGGVETVGLAQAVNDMLVQSDGLHIQLFPAWPVDEPASFKSLRAKGSFVISATWDANARRPRDVHIAVDRASDGSCGLVVGANRAVHVQCASAGDLDLQTLYLCGDAAGRVRWPVPGGAVCNVTFDGTCNMTRL